MSTRPSVIDSPKREAMRIAGDKVFSDREAKTPAPAAAERVLYRALSRGLSFKTTMGCVLTLTPPLITTETEMMQALDILDACLDEERP